MKSLRVMKWFFLPILFLSILACATDRTVTQTPPSNVPSQAVPTSILQTLSFTEEAGYTRIRLEGSEPLSPPIYQVLSNPLRIVIDLPNTDLKKVKEPVKIGNGTIGEVWATQYDDKGRIEIHLIQMANYNITREDRILNIDVEQVKKAEEAKEEKPGKEAVAVKEKETEVTPVDVKTESPVPAASEKPVSPPEGERKETKAKTLTDLSLEKKDDSVSFNIVADGKIENYDSFRLESPSRLVIDLLEMDSRLDRKRFKFQNDFIKEVRLGQYPNKVRLVFDSLKSALPPHQINRMEDRIVVSFGNVPQPPGPQIVLQEKVVQEGGVQKEKEGQAEPAPASGKKESAPVVPASKGKAGTITAIDFKQFDQKSRIVVSGTGEPELESLLISKKVLAFNLKNTIIPKHLQRDLDTHEFKSAVLSIQLQNVKRGKANDARILVKLKEEVPYETSWEGKALFIDIENPKAIEAKGDVKGEVKAAVVPATVKEGSPPQEAKKEEVRTEAVKIEEPKKEEETKKQEVKKEESKTEEAVKKEEAKITPETKTAPKEASGIPPGDDKKTSPPPAEKKRDSLGESAVQEKAYSGSKISLDFKDADIKNILRLIAEVSNLNLIAGEDVSGKVTMRLVNVPWDQALDVILSAKNLGMTRSGNVIRIAPMDVLKKELQSELEAKRAKEKLEDLMTELVSVNYATAKELVVQVKSVLSERGDVKVDDRTNLLIVKDIPKNIAGVKNLVRQLDTRTPQVMIEARIIEANLTFQRELGISWGFDKKFGKQTEIKGGLPGNKLVDFPAAPATGTAGVFQFLINSAAGMTELDIAISAHELNGDVKIISSPKIATLDNKEASIEQGLRIPYLKLTAEGTATTDFIEANLKLTVTPHVTNDGHVKMLIKAKKDAPTREFEVLGVPSIDKKEAITEVMIKDNGVVVIGGIFTIDKQGSVEGIPLLNKIPLLGWLFKRDSKSDQRKDLLIFISPKIVKEQV
jgi:type IV pilus assembly protein PilQ